MREGRYIATHSLPWHEMEVGGGQLHPPAIRISGKGSWLGGWVDRRAGLDALALMKRKVFIPAISLTPSVVFTQLF